MRRGRSAMNSSIVAMSARSVGRGAGDDGANSLTEDDAAEGPVGGLEHVDRQVVVHAQRQRRRVHHAQAALDGLEMRDLRDQLGIRVDAWVAVVDALHPVL